MEENWLTPTLKNCVHQQKKASNKSTKFVIKQKSVSTGQNEGFPEKYNFTGPKSYFESVSEKNLKKRFLLAEARFFKNIGLPLIAIMVS